MNGDWIDSRMWFLSADKGWKLAGKGGIYRDPASKEIVSIMRAVNMDGFIFFRTKLILNGGAIGTEISAVRQNGSILKLKEQWHFPSKDRFKYISYTDDNGTHVIVSKGGWIRAKEALPRTLVENEVPTQRKGK